MSFAPALALREGDHEKLADLARLPSVPSGLAPASASAIARPSPRAAPVTNATWPCMSNLGSTGITLLTSPAPH
jgi:hypothetical protein